MFPSIPKVTGCSHFSYWQDGGCHLQDSKCLGFCDLTLEKKAYRVQVT